MTNTPEFYTSSEVMDLFGINHHTLRKWIITGKIKRDQQVMYDEDFFTREEVARIAQERYGSK